MNYLLQNKFSAHSDQEKVEIKRLGLNALAMLSIHKDLVQDTRNFNEMVIDKFVHLKNRRAEFLYKGRPGEEN